MAKSPKCVWVHPTPPSSLPTGMILSTFREIYTFGQGDNGQLGHNDGGKSYQEPKMIDFFYKNNLKAIDVACGEKHTVVLTQDGDVWTFGWGGRKLNALFQIFYSSTGPLGHGDSKTHHTPVPVEELRKHPKVISVNAGRSFTTVVNKNN
jgi:alpha-tubulin suppressor-like RCC1 family protein